MHLSIVIELLESCDGDQLRWPFLGTVTFELLNQLGDGNHYKAEVPYEADNDMTIDSAESCDDFVGHSSLSNNPEINTQYLLDDSLYFRVSVRIDNHKPWLVNTDKGAISTIGNCKVLNAGESLIFKCSNFKMKCAQLDCTSYSFYTSPGGYYMCVCVLGHSDGKGTRASGRH